jgi:thioredoxin reductase (NADPH)
VTGWVESGGQNRIRNGAATPYASHPRIFAVGDVRAASVKRVASAVGEGSVVVSAIWSTP